MMLSVLVFLLSRTWTLSETADIQYQWTLISNSVYQSLSACACEEGIVWKAQPPLSRCRQNGTSSCSLAELMPQRLHPPLCFHTTVRCRHLNAPLVKPPNKWKSASSLKLLMIIFPSPPSPPPPYLTHSLPSSPFLVLLSPSAILQQPAFF